VEPGITSQETFQSLLFSFGSSPKLLGGANPVSAILHATVILMGYFVVLMKLSVEKKVLKKELQSFVLRERK
jgi:hypothetical protein